MFEDLITELTTMATDAAPIGLAVIGLIALAAGVGWAKKIGGKAG